jgi:CRISPR system Cascade subunit CasE
MSWLARLDVDAAIARAEGMTDNYAWHKKIWECFPYIQDSKRDFLTRIDLLEKGFRVWVMARQKPVRPQWCPAGAFLLKEIAPSFLTHRYYAFDVRANPTKRLSNRTVESTNPGPGKRIPLTKPDELRDWLRRKGAASSFAVREDKPLEIGPMVQNHFRRAGHSAYHGGVQFRGILEVTDRERFSTAYHAGIGSTKSFGFGLLLLAPVTE